MVIDKLYILYQCINCVTDTTFFISTNVNSIASAITERQAFYHHIFAINNVDSVSPLAIGQSRVFWLIHYKWCSVTNHRDSIAVDKPYQIGEDKVEFSGQCAQYNSGFENDGFVRQIEKGARANIPIPRLQIDDYRIIRGVNCRLESICSIGRVEAKRWSQNWRCRNIKSYEQKCSYIRTKWGYYFSCLFFCFKVDSEELCVNKY